MEDTVACDMAGVGLCGDEVGGHAASEADNAHRRHHRSACPSRDAYYSWI